LSRSGRPRGRSDETCMHSMQKVGLARAPYVEGETAPPDDVDRAASVGDF
jgi:hypothetical protein